MVFLNWAKKLPWKFPVRSQWVNGVNKKGKSSSDIFTVSVDSPFEAFTQSRMIEAGDEIDVRFKKKLPKNFKPEEGEEEFLEDESTDVKKMHDDEDETPEETSDDAEKEGDKDQPVIAVDDNPV